MATAFIKIPSTSVGAKRISLPAATKNTHQQLKLKFTTPSNLQTLKCIYQKLIRLNCATCLGGLKFPPAERIRQINFFA
jgi:hypothetical protein